MSVCASHFQTVLSISSTYGIKYRGRFVLSGCKCVGVGNGQAKGQGGGGQSKDGKEKHGGGKGF